MGYKQRLELDWIGKDKVLTLESRILIEDCEKSFGNEGSENMIIHGDNLLALKALEDEYRSKIKTIIIDPPYNTGSAFSHYEDGLEHSQWLSLMRDRIVILEKLLCEEGSLWITIDDNEVHYLKVLCDEIFGRHNFVSNVVWQKRTSPDMRATLGAGHDHILVYAKNLSIFKKVIKPLSKTEKQKATYKNPDKDPRGPWVSSDFTAQGFRPNQMYSITTPGGAVYEPPEGRCWKNVKAVLLQSVKEGRMWFGKDGKRVPRRKTYLSESKGQNTWSWWPNSEVGHNQEAKKEINALFGAANAFDTPKPERLIHRIIQLTTNECDTVLDSFSGSGTTGAVAHKMNRKWIMIELGDHCYSHIIPRMHKVVSGEDQGGVSKELNWDGGGGFKFYSLAPSLLQKDDRGNWIINNEYNAIQLAEAVCKHEKFKFHPDESIYWKQGFSSERDYIFVTTQFLTSEHLNRIQSQMKKNESLLICAKAFRVKKDKYPNITLKKIPQMLLGRCQFGQDDYSLNVIEQVELSIGSKQPRKTK